jgi:hypothetical protein
MSRLLAAVCLCLAVNAAKAEAAFIQSTIEFNFTEVSWGTRLFLQSGDPVTFQSICLTVQGAPAGSLFLVNNSSPCGGVLFGGTSLKVIAPPGFSGNLTLTFIVTQPDTGVEVARRTFGGFAPPPPPPPGSRTLRVRAAKWDGSSFLAPEPAAGAAVPATARIPLGAVVSLQAIDSDGALVPASFTFESVNLDPGVEEGALFDGAVLHRFVSSDADQAHVQAVHLGLTTVRVTPSDSSLPPGTISIEVVSPARFGAQTNDVDADVIAVAQRTGVPPDFIRAHVSKESGNNRLAYRYEPIGPTYGDLFFASRGRNVRTRPTYRDYRLATVADTLNQALAEGMLLLPADKNPRSSLRINCNPDGTGGEPVGTNPTPNPLAWEIFRCNDKDTPGRQNWETNAGDAGPARVRRLSESPFTAQTTIAASYGLMQVMYGLAIGLGWSTDANEQNPSLLFDTLGAPGRGEGSLLVGSRFVRKLLGDYMAETSATFTSRDNLLLLLNGALRGYNPGQRGYGADVAGRVQTFVPATDGPIIQP